jgi:membrane associated rhomboid family serine protease
VIDILPTLALCTSRPDPDQATIKAWSLVLSSRRFLSRVENGRLLVAPALAARAVAEITSYEAENRSRPRPAPLPDKTRVSLAVVGLFLLANLWMDNGLGQGAAWYLAGRADAGLILAGQWWRCVTGLGLHADAGHLLANAAALGLLAPLLARRIGSGLAWGLFVFSGTLGNALNAWAQAPHHLSVGASTGVFGLIGVLAGGAGRAERNERMRTLLLALGFAFSLLALLGAGEDPVDRVDLGAHFFGLCCGLPCGFLLGNWHGLSGWKIWLNRLAGAGALGLVLWAWRAALAG